MILVKGVEIGDVLFEHPDVDAGSLSYSKKRKVVTGASYTTDKGHRVYMDDLAEKTYRFLEDRFPNHEVVISNSNKNENLHMVRTYSDRSLGSYYVLDSDKWTINHITDVSPWIEEADLAEMQHIQYTSRDGLVINGYLTLPKGVRKDLPLVVNPHGGPWVRDSWTYNPEVQLMANRGYAVLQMNYRGSTGYGRTFWEKGFKQWGRQMQDDITDGVEHLISEGTVDRQRVAIYGGSYGGYATLAGVTFTPRLI